MTKTFCDRCDTEATRVMKLTIPSFIGDVTIIELCDQCLAAVSNCALYRVFKEPAFGTPREKARV